MIADLKVEPLVNTFTKISDNTCLSETNYQKTARGRSEPKPQVTSALRTHAIISPEYPQDSKQPPIIIKHAHQPTILRSSVKYQLPPSKFFNCTPRGQIPQAPGGEFLGPREHTRNRKYRIHSCGANDFNYIRKNSA